MPDTSLGITYPASTAHTRIWEHVQTVAEDVDLPDAADFNPVRMRELFLIGFQAGHGADAWETQPPAIGGQVTTPP